MVYTFYYNTLSEKYAVDVRQIVFQFSNENFRDPLISLPHTHALISPRYISEGGGEGGGGIEWKGSRNVVEKNLNLKKEKEREILKFEKY